jgi:uncharacterized membrane protein
LIASAIKIQEKEEHDETFISPDIRAHRCAGADHDTHAMAPDGAWNKIVHRFLANVKAGRVADGVLDAIAACGAILKEHHPAQPSMP